MEAWENHLLKESWRLLEAPLESSWRCLGGAKASSGKPLLPEPSWRPGAAKIRFWSQFLRFTKFKHTF